MQKIIILSLFLFISIPNLSFGQNQDYKKAKKLIQKVKNQLVSGKNISFNFKRNHEFFGHLSEPWQTRKYIMAGKFCLNSNDELYIIDSLNSRGKYHQSQQFYSTDILFLLNYGTDKARKVTTKDFNEYLNTASLFSPIFYLEEFLKNAYQNNNFEYNQGKATSITFQNTQGNIIKIIIDKTNKQVLEIHITYPHELYGDVLKKIIYSDYQQYPQTKQYYASSIIEKELGIKANQMSITTSTEKLDIQDIKGIIPENYSLSKTVIDKPEIIYQKYNEYLHLLELKHTDDRVLIVEFEDFLLVAEAPLNTKNGQLIIEKAKEIIPQKPIKYFVFGHHHPHYLGGIRAFVANESTILCYKDNVEYVNKIISAKHSLNPDILEKNRKHAKIETIDIQKIISDGNIEIQIIHIGTMSAHTKDFLIYYFPKDEIIFEDDLVWIAKDEPIKSASARQKGLYDAIIKYNLDVKTIIQSWPVASYNIKTIIEFQDLKKSVETIEN